MCTCVVSCLAVANGSTCGPELAARSALVWVHPTAPYMQLDSPRQTPKAQAHTRASRTTRSASPADCPCGRKPPSTEMLCGSSPQCPMTAMPADTTARAATSRAPPPPAKQEGTSTEARAISCKIHANHICASVSVNIRPCQPTKMRSGKCHSWTAWCIPVAQRKQLGVDHRQQLCEHIDVLLGLARAGGAQEQPWARAALALGGQHPRASRRPWCPL